MRVVREVRQFLNHHSLVASPGVVAVSGGPDSVALVRALHEIGVSRIIVAHINHQLRGKESDEDEEFVRSLAEELNLELRLLSVDVATAATGENLEATARTMRYRFLEDVATETEARWIATGHNANDQAETVLHRLIRGTGLQGLAGISPVRKLHENANCLLIRPLLSTSRTEILDYLSAGSHLYRQDASNMDLRLTRNRLRHEVLPLLASFNPQVISALAQVADQARESLAIVHADADQLLMATELPRAGNALVFDTMRLQTEEPARVREVLRLAWQREGWPSSDLSAEHWERLVDIVQGRLKAADFPHAVSARRVGRAMRIVRTP